MPESAEEMYRRAVAAAGPDGRLRMPPVHEWDTFPFDGELRVRELKPPLAVEPARLGEQAGDCWRCLKGPDDAIWSDAHWLLTPLLKPSGMPVVVILQPRTHHDLADLPDELVFELGPLIVRVERAVQAVGEIGRVHVCRWGDGSVHFHLWFMGRPARLTQVSTSFAAIWDEILPPVPEEIWRANLAAVATALAESGGTAHV